MINFCHISPTPYLDSFCSAQTHHLLLAHLIEPGNAYTAWYDRNKDTNKTYIVDNSAFEMAKQGKPMLDPDVLIDKATLVGGDYVVMSDYPTERGAKTIEAAERLAPQFRAAGFGTFFVPQSEVGDIDDYIETFAWAAKSPHVDYIGVSILGVPNAFGVEKGNKMQRFLSRWKMMSILEKCGILDTAQKNGKKIHFLGMVDGPNEIELCGRLFKIDTWDSSAAVWRGLNLLGFDESPTGCLEGKYENEVDFDIEFTDNVDQRMVLAMQNMSYINYLCSRF